MVYHVKKVFPHSQCISIPFSDGGEGALNVLENHAHGSLMWCKTTDALKRPINAPYFLFKKEKTAWVELSQTAGLAILDETERNPLKTSTWGTGLMLKKVLDKGCEKIYLGIGGSATHDLGLGIITALGGKLYNKEGKILEACGENLSQIESIDLSELDPRVKKIKWIIACDVQNPLTGKNGASHTYAKQKGATAQIIEQLETGSKQFAKIVKKQFGKDIKILLGGGAAGGVSAGLFGVFNASLNKGFELLAQLTQLDYKIKNMDLVLTGEGNFDRQSTFGKLPIQVAKLSLPYKIPTLLFTGRASLKELSEMPHLKIYQITPPSMLIAEAMEKASQNINDKLLEVLQDLKDKSY